jgi:hypothetical protein
MARPFLVVMRFVEPGPELRLGRKSWAARATIASNSTTPVEKFGATVMPVPALFTAEPGPRLHARSTRSCRRRR